MRCRWTAMSASSSTPTTAAFRSAPFPRTDVVRTRWDVAGAGLSRDGRFLTVAINNDARTELRVFDAATLKPVELPTLPGADVTGVTFSKDSSRIAFYAESAGPRDLYVRNVATG